MGVGRPGGRDEPVGICLELVLLLPGRRRWKTKYALKWRDFNSAVASVDRSDLLIIV